MQSQPSSKDGLATAQRVANAKAAAADKAAKAKAKVEAAKAKVKSEAYNARWLERTAKTINAVIQRAEVAYGKVEDYRASIAIKLAEAEVVCRSSGTKFQSWAEAYIVRQDGSGPYTYTEVRRLTKIGRLAQGSEEEARKLMDQMRADTAKRVREHQARKSRKKKEALEAPPGVGHNQGPPLLAGVTVEGVLNAVEELSPANQIVLLEQLGQTMGLTITITKSGRQVWPVI